MLRYRVASEIGQSVAWVEDNLTTRELFGWAGYFLLESEEQKKAMDKAKGKAKSNPGPKGGGGIRFGRSKSAGK